jgi:hypothetical protein
MRGSRARPLSTSCTWPRSSHCLKWLRCATSGASLASGCEAGEGAVLQCRAVDLPEVSGWSRQASFPEASPAAEIIVAGVRRCLRCPPSLGYRTSAASGASSWTTPRWTQSYTSEVRRRMRGQLKPGTLRASTGITKKNLISSVRSFGALLGLK